VGLFDETSETPSSREGRRVVASRDTLFDWLVRRAEADLGVAQALATGETQRADQIKRLETTLIGQISRLQHQIIESREAEVNDLKSEILACADRIALFERTHDTGDAVKQVIQELGDLRSQLNARQTELECRYLNLDRLGESLGGHIRSLEEDLRAKLDDIRTAQGEMRHFQSETQSLAERVAHAESATWQARTLAVRNAQQLEQNNESLRNEIAPLKVFFAELSNNQRNLPLYDKLLEGIGTKIEELHEWLAQTQNTQAERDIRLERLDAGLAMLTGRVSKAESVSHQTQALIQAGIDSASEFRDKTGRELAALHSQLNDSTADQRLEDIQLSLRAKMEEWQHQSVQRLMLLESRDSEWEKTARELAMSLSVKLAEHEAHTDDRLRLLANDRQELSCFGPEIQKLAKRMADAESATLGAQALAEASGKRTSLLEEGLQKDIAALNAEVDRLAGQQHAFHLTEDELSALERRLTSKVEELQRQLAIEREGFDHWGKGLHQSFGAELSAIQARLSERQSQIEHRYARLEHEQETVNTALNSVETQLKENLQPCAHHQQEWSKLQSDLDTLGVRAKQLEERTRQVEDRAAALTCNSEQNTTDLQRQISALENADSIIHGLQKTLSGRLLDLQQTFMAQLTQCDNRNAERARQSDEILNALQANLAGITAALEEKQSARPSIDALSRAIEDPLSTKIHDLDQQLAARFSEIERRETERAHHTDKSFETLQSELTAIKNEVNQRMALPAEASMRSLEQGVGAKVQDFQQHVTQQLLLHEKRDTGRIEQIEHLLAGFKIEIETISEELIRRPTAMSPADPVLRGFEENLTTKIDELRQQMSQKFSEFGAWESDFKELKDRSQALIHRVTQLSAAIQAPPNTEGWALQPMAPLPPASQPPRPTGAIESHSNTAEMQAGTEKEQLIKLQERMSSEIERVRAELKERSGRWKVRKSAS
jgi:chromosome segregation ATPase